MSRFAPILSALNERLPLPQPARSRVLLEIAADLEACYEAAREQGLSEVEAEALAVETFGPSSEAVADLVRVHGSPLASLMNGLAGQAHDLWERMALLIAVLGTLALSASCFADLRIFQLAGWAAWPVTLLAVLAISIGLAKVYLLFIKRDHRPGALNRGLTALLLLAAAPALIGFIVFPFDLYVALDQIAGAWPRSDMELMRLLLRGHALLCIALTGTLLASLLWFVTVRRTSLIEEQEAELLLQLEGEES
jgi:hypothetical protein